MQVYFCVSKTKFSMAKFNTSSNIVFPRNVTVQLSPLLHVNIGWPAELEWPLVLAMCTNTISLVASWGTVFGTPVASRATKTVPQLATRDIQVALKWLLSGEPSLELPARCSVAIQAMSSKTGEPLNTNNWTMDKMRSNLGRNQVSFRQPSRWPGHNGITRFNWRAGQGITRVVIERPKILKAMTLNSLRPSDAIWRHRSGSTLAQVMACCLTALSHYLNQCWLIISKVLWHSSEGIIMRRSEDTNQ